MSLAFYFWNRYFLSFLNGLKKLNVFNILVIQTFQTCSELKLRAEKKLIRRILFDKSWSVKNSIFVYIL